MNLSSAINIENKQGWKYLGKWLNMRKSWKTNSEVWKRKIHRTTNANTNVKWATTTTCTTLQCHTWNHEVYM